MPERTLRIGVQWCKTGDTQQVFYITYRKERKRNNECLGRRTRSFEVFYALLSLVGTSLTSTETQHVVFVRFKRHLIR